jgi:DHA2 family methylenomycin A resistance protein-like MFS transporter
VPAVDGHGDQPGLPQGCASGLDSVDIGTSIPSAKPAQGGARGWTSPPILGAFAAAAVLLAGFVAVEGRRAAPMLPLRLFRQRLVGPARRAADPARLPRHGRRRPVRRPARRPVRLPGRGHRRPDARRAGAADAGLRARGHALPERVVATGGGRRRLRPHPVPADRGRDPGRRPHEGAWRRASAAPPGRSARCWVWRCPAPWCAPGSPGGASFETGLGSAFVTAGVVTLAGALVTGLWLVRSRPAGAPSPAGRS